MEPTFQLLRRSRLTREGTKPMWRRGTMMVWKGTVARTVTGMEEESRGEGRGAAEEESRGESREREERRVESAGNAARCDEAGQVSPSKSGSCGAETPDSRASKQVGVPVRGNFPRGLPPRGNDREPSGIPCCQCRPNASRPIGSHCHRCLPNECIHSTMQKPSSRSSVS